MPKDIDTDSSRKVVLSNITLVSSHQSEHPPQSANVMKKRIIKNNVAHASNPTLIMSIIFYFKFYFYIITI